MTLTSGAGAGALHAHVQLGVCYQLGIGVPEDSAEAAKQCTYGRCGHWRLGPL